MSRLHSVHAEIWSYRTNDTIEPIRNVLDVLGDFAKEFDPDINYVVNMVNDRGPSLDIWYSPGTIDHSQEIMYLRKVCNAVTDRVSFTDFDIHTD